MSKPPVNTIAALFSLALTLALPCAASAASIVFDSRGTGQVAGWKPVNAATSSGQQGYWDRRSYDSATNATPGACSAGTLVGGVPCDWNSPTGVRSITSPSQRTPGQGYEYFGLLSPTSPGEDAPLDFFFTGPFDFDWTVLFQLTAWDDHVEFGWYEAGNPDNRTPIIGPSGPYTANDGQPGTTGQSAREEREGRGLGDVVLRPPDQEIVEVVVRAGLVAQVVAELRRHPPELVLDAEPVAVALAEQHELLERRRAVRCGKRRLVFEP